jgi:hypothetical protein
LQTLGDQTITITDVTSSNSYAVTTSNPIAVYGAATQFVLTPASAVSVAAGTAVSYTVTAEDMNGDTALGYRGKVSFTSTDPKAVLPAAYTFTAANDGVHTFTVIYKTAGNQTLTVTDAVDGIIVQNSNVTVTPLTASKLVLTPIAPTTGIVAGSTVQFSVTAEDVYGNTATTFAGTVVFTSNDPKAQLPPSTPLSNGTGTFTTAILETAGNHTITAASSGLTSSSGAFGVVAAAASYFVVAVPATATAGTAFSITLTAKDQYGNTATSYSGTVTLSLTDGTTITPTSVNVTNGVATFAVTVDTVGTETIVADDTVNSISGTSAGIKVAAAATGSKHA